MLDKQQEKFIDKYLVTYNMEGAAIAAGYPREEALKIAIDLLSTDVIQEALKERGQQLEQAMTASKMTKEKFITTMYYQYVTAVNRGDIKCATDILEKIARWSGISPDDIKVEPVNLIINNVDESKI